MRVFAYLHICLHTVCIFSAHGDQKRGQWDTLELQWVMAVEPSFQPVCLLFYFFGTGSCYVVLAGIEQLISNVS